MGGWYNTNQWRDHWKLKKKKETDSYNLRIVLTQCKGLWNSHNFFKCFRDSFYKVRSWLLVCNWQNFKPLTFLVFVRINHILDAYKNCWSKGFLFKIFNCEILLCFAIGDKYDNFMTSTPFKKEKKKKTYCSSLAVCIIYALTKHVFCLYLGFCIVI